MNIDKWHNLILLMMIFPTVKFLLVQKGYIKMLCSGAVILKEPNEQHIINPTYIQWNPGL